MQSHKVRSLLRVLFPGAVFANDTFMRITQKSLIRNLQANDPSTNYIYCLEGHVDALGREWK